MSKKAADTTSIKDASNGKENTTPNIVRGEIELNDKKPVQKSKKNEKAQSALGGNADIEKQGRDEEEGIDFEDIQINVDKDKVEGAPEGNQSIQMPLERSTEKMMNAYQTDQGNHDPLNDTPRPGGHLQLGPGAHEDVRESHLSMARGQSDVGLKYVSSEEEEADAQLLPQTEKRIEQYESRRKCVWIMIFSMTIFLLVIVGSIIIVKVATDEEVQQRDSEDLNGEKTSIYG